MKYLATLLAVALIISTGAAQQMTLTTTYANNNGQSGNMFDLQATSCLTIDSFNCNLDAGTWDMEIYTLSGNFAGNETNPAAWTLVGSATGVVGAGPGLATPVPITVGITMTPGEIRAFYVTVTNGTAINYTNGTTQGAVFASDANLTFFEGTGNAYPFGGFFTPRVFNGDILYTPMSPCTGPYEDNDAASSLDVDGVQGSIGAPAIVSGCTGQVFNLNSAAPAGQGYDIGYHFSAVIPAPPGLVTPGGQRVNVNLTDPTFQTLNGGPGLNLVFAPHPGAFTIPVSFNSGLTVTGQQAATDPGSVDGIALSQPCQLDVVAGAPVALTLGDDDNTQVFLQGNPVCGNSVTFYGTVYTDIFVNSNGDVSFGSGHTDFSATSGEWVSQMPRIGFQTDLEPNNFGTITLTNNGAGANGDWLTIAFANVTEWGTGGMGVTSYDIVLHGPAGHEIANFTTDGTWGGTATVAGISNGSLGAAVANLQSFDTNNGLGVIPSLGGPTDNVIDENTAGMIPNATGWTSVGFPFEDGSAHVVQ